MRKTRNLLESFRWALEGLLWIARQRNVLIIALIALLALGLALGLGFSAMQLTILILAIFTPLAFELINTAIELLLDHLVQEPHPGVKRIKDIAAAAVFLSVTGSVAATLMLFWGPLGLPQESLLLKLVGSLLMALLFSLALWGIKSRKK